MAQLDETSTDNQSPRRRDRGRSRRISPGTDRLSYRQRPTTSSALETNEPPVNRESLDRESAKKDDIRFGGILRTKEQKANAKKRLEQFRSEDTARRLQQKDNRKEGVKEKNKPTARQQVVRKFSKTVGQVSILKDGVYLGLITLALLKDLLDLLQFGIVFILITFVLSVCIGFVIWFVMIFFVAVEGLSDNASASRLLIQRSLILFFGMGIDALPFIGIFPLTTATVIYIYYRTLRERARYEQKKVQKEAAVAA